MTLSKNDRYVVTCCRDTTIKVWDLKPKTELEATLDPKKAGKHPLNI